MKRLNGFLSAACLAALLTPTLAHAQLFTWTREQMLDYTKAWTGDRFPDGRPKVPDAMLNRARGLSQEEVTINFGAGGLGIGGHSATTPYSQYTGDWQVLHPGKTMVGRAVTAAFLPARPDLDTVVIAKAKEKGIATLTHQYVLDMLQSGDVLVVDLFGKVEGGTLVGDNLFSTLRRPPRTEAWW